MNVAWGQVANLGSRLRNPVDVEVKELSLCAQAIRHGRK